MLENEIALRQGLGARVATRQVGIAGDVGTPVGSTNTTDGIVLAPDAPENTCTLAPSKYAQQLKVVPKSMPTQ
jgi:hypothetical protein